MRRTILVCLVLLLSGCGYEPLYSDLDERQVNEMLALLLHHGHDARKTFVDKSWSLQIKTADIAAAMTVLDAEGLPRERYDTLGQVFAKQGLVSTPLEERARLLHALSQELSRTLSSIDGVISARVHLAIPQQSPMEEERAPSSASVFIKHRPGAQIINKTASIKSLVVNGVEGLPYDKVTVTFFVTGATSAPPRPIEPTYAGTALPMLTPQTALLATVPMAVLLGVLVWRRRRAMVRA